MNLWNNKTEIDFFKKSLLIHSPEQLFYDLNGIYYAYIPKKLKSSGQVVNSRNSSIGNFTEMWCKNLITPIAESLNLFAINGIICPELALTKNSPADLSLCTKNAIMQKAEDVKIIFEIKMSIISNYKYDSDSIEFCGDYTTHRGNPSLYRSDSMLKAIGKSINIRNSIKSSSIPIIIIGNSPITKNYIKKVDNLVKSGIIQKFISVNPEPTNSPHITDTPQKGFITLKNYSELVNIIKNFIHFDGYYFSSMLPKSKLGEIISISNKMNTDKEKAEKFLTLLRQ